jgi:hypothetical protein
MMIAMIEVDPISFWILVVIAVASLIWNGVNSYMLWELKEELKMTIHVIHAQLDSHEMELPTKRIIEARATLPDGSLSAPMKWQEESTYAKSPPDHPYGMITAEEAVKNIEEFRESLRKHGIITDDTETPNPDLRSQNEA